MSLKCQQNPDAPLFHLVNCSWDKNGHIIQCILIYKEKASFTIPGLIPLLRYVFGGRVENCFPPETVEQMQIAQFDAITGEIATSMDDHIAQIDEGDADSDLH